MRSQQEKNVYDDDDIPPIDLPKDVIPDEVPRRDGPGGEGKTNSSLNKSAK
ncbi:MAG: hypothetical protein ACI4EL_01150 [Candidatus Fimimorpha sp.]